MTAKTIAAAEAKLNPMATKDFEKALTALINEHGLDNATDTPDYLLAEFLVGCLKAFSEVQKAKISTLLAQLQAQQKNKF